MVVAVLEFGRETEEPTWLTSFLFPARLDGISDDFLAGRVFLYANIVETVFSFTLYYPLLP